MLSDADVLCAFGAKESGDFALINKWVSKKAGRRAFLFQEEASLETAVSDLVECLSTENEEDFKRVAWDALFARLSFHNFDKQKQPRAEELFAKVTQIHLGVELLASDYSDMGAQLLSNLFKNAPLLARAKSAGHLRDSFPGTPAVICGAGPSLAKNGHLLHVLKERALLFAGGSALGALSRFGTTPHFAASIDPDSPSRRFAQQNAFEVPFFFQTRTAAPVMALTHNPLFFVADSGGYPVEGWLRQQLGQEEGAFDGGWNVATLSLALAAKMGCNPLILVGMDLCSKTRQVYAPGVALAGEKRTLIETRDQSGAPVFSQRDWLMAKQWIETFIEENPHIEVINATEGGIGFKGARNVALSLIEMGGMSGLCDLEALVHATCLSLPPISSSETIAQALSELKKSFTRCDELCGAALAEREAHYPNEGISMLHEFELGEEIAAQLHLEPLWQIWKHMIVRKINPAHITINKLLLFKKILQEINYGAL
jgi:hypothetical protein